MSDAFEKKYERPADELALTQGNRLNAAQMQAIQDAAKRFGETVALKQWCVQKAIDATANTRSAGGSVMDLAEAIHRFLTQSSAGS